VKKEKVRFSLEEQEKALFKTQAAGRKSAQERFF